MNTLSSPSSTFPSATKFHKIFNVTNPPPHTSKSSVRVILWLKNFFFSSPPIQGTDLSAPQTYRFLQKFSPEDRILESLEFSNLGGL